MASALGVEPALTLGAALALAAADRDAACVGLTAPVRLGISEARGDALPLEPAEMVEVAVREAEPVVTADGVRVKRALHVTLPLPDAVGETLGERDGSAERLPVGLDVRVAFALALRSAELLPVPLTERAAVAVTVLDTVPVPPLLRVVDGERLGEPLPLALRVSETLPLLLPLAVDVRVPTDAVDVPL